MIETANSGTSEGVRKSWEHRTRSSALAHLKELRKQGFRGRASVEKDPRDNTFFVRREEGELAERKPAEELTPYDKDIRRMKKFGTQDMHGALADIIFSDKSAREEYEGDQPGASWEDAAADLATNYLSLHRTAQQNHGNERIMKPTERMTELVSAEMRTAKVGYDQAWANVKASKEGKELVTAMANAGSSEGAKKGWQHRVRPFGKSDWDGLAGAESPESGEEPIVGYRDHPNNHSWTAVADKNGVSVMHSDSEGEHLGEHRLDVPFETGRHVVEAALNAPSNKHLEKMGFKWHGNGHDTPPHLK